MVESALGELSYTVHRRYTVAKHVKNDLRKPQPIRSQDWESLVASLEVKKPINQSVNTYIQIKSFISRPKPKPKPSKQPINQTGKQRKPKLHSTITPSRPRPLKTVNNPPQPILEQVRNIPNRVPMREQIPAASTVAVVV